MKENIPAWAKKKPGNKRAQTVPRGCIEKAKMSLFPQNYHAGCGGRWRTVGQSGVLHFKGISRNRDVLRHGLRSAGYCRTDETSH